MLFIPLYALFNSYKLKQYVYNSHIKGSVSRDLLFTICYTSIESYHPLAENFKFIKGLVHNLHKTGRRTLVLWYGFIQTIFKAEENMGCAILKFATAPLSDMNFVLFFRIFDRPGLNFNAINLKISHMVGLIEGYNLCKF